MWTFYCPHCLYNVPHLAQRSVVEHACFRSGVLLFECWCQACNLKVNADTGNIARCLEPASGDHCWRDQRLFCAATLGCKRSPEAARSCACACARRTYARVGIFFVLAAVALHHTSAVQRVNLDKQPTMLLRPLLHGVAVQMALSTCHFCYLFCDFLLFWGLLYYDRR